MSGNPLSTSAILVLSHENINLSIKIRFKK
jgi:hypothetical protein